MKIISIIIVVLLVLIISSCHNDNPVIPTGETKINSINSDSLAIGDTLVINGEFFGEQTKSKYLLFDSAIKIDSYDCIRWTENSIMLIIPKNSKSGFVCLYDSVSARDSIYIGISPVPLFETVEIPAGKFLRGSENSAKNEIPMREITISKSFVISKYEVTQRLYYQTTKNKPTDLVNLILPIVNVEWIDAVKFCNTLSEIHNLTPYYIVAGTQVNTVLNSNGWRLPTEAEWEYACKGGKNSDYSGTGLIEEMGWYSDNSGLKIHPGGRKKSNDLGIFDMHGNCWEWCWDFYDENYYQMSPEKDPQGPSDGTIHVLRGGSSFDGKNYSRSSNRTIPSTFQNNIGIRIVRNID